MGESDSIAALCGGAGGAIAIVRISGPEALAIASAVWKAPRGAGLSASNPRRMVLGKAAFDGGEPILAVYMPGPKSYTGEDVVELHCHGGAAAPKRLLDAVLRKGARMAGPGEFTRRAFVNGRMDLTQAEAVAELIASKSASALALAERQVSGSLGRELKAIRSKLLEILADVESRMDFPEEDIPWGPKDELASAVLSCEEASARLLASRREGYLIREGLRLVIAGRPNAGKSSLLNALLGFERAIVSPVPGTTRDTIEELASIGGVSVRVTDTAGLRESSDDVELLGVERSRKALAQAEAVFWVLDATAADLNAEASCLKETLPEGLLAIAVWSKADLFDRSRALPELGIPAVLVSSTTGEGLPALASLFSKTVWGSESRAEPETAVSSRHAALLEEAVPFLGEARGKILLEQWELAASSLRAATRALGEISGEDANPDVLDSIFSRFCIGK